MSRTFTYTTAKLEISSSAYDEIAAKLRAAGYDHAFSHDGSIDMHGIALTRVVRPRRRVFTSVEVKQLQVVAQRHPRRVPHGTIAALGKKLGRSKSSLEIKLAALRRQVERQARRDNGLYHGLKRE